MNTIKMMFGEMEIKFPMVIERIRLYEALIHNNIATWTPATEWATLDICKVVPMTAHEMAWFTRL
jgi:hypothetical protein